VQIEIAITTLKYCTIKNKDTSLSATDKLLCNKHQIHHLLNQLKTKHTAIKQTNKKTSEYILHEQQTKTFNNSDQQTNSDMLNKFIKLRTLFCLFTTFICSEKNI